MEVLSADFGFMFWKLDSQNTYQLVYTSPETPYKPKLPRKRGYNYLASLKRIPYFVTLPKRDLLPFMKSIAIIPIFYKYHQYGNIVLCFKKKKTFEEDEKTLTMTLGNSAAQVLTLHRATKKAEKNSQKLLRQKDEFFNTVSHELRTPATTIKGFSQILLEKSEKSDKNTKHFLERMNNQVDKLSRLINDLLDVSRIETGKMIFQKRNFELKSLIRQVITGLKVAIPSHPITFKSDYHIYVHGDSEYIERVIINLITNAAKYSPQGSKIKICLREKDGKAVVEVEDYGFGVSKKDKAKIFNRFFRSNHSNRKNLPGLGLGLYIANSIVKEHGGKLDFKSKTKSKGMVFFFTLPYYDLKINGKS